LVNVVNGVLSDKLDEYLKNPHPTAEDWNEVTSAIDGVLTDSKKLLDELEKQGSDLG
jgi:hypothetical protein